MRGGATGCQAENEGAFRGGGKVVDTIHYITGGPITHMFGVLQRDEAHGDLLFSVMNRVLIFFCVN